MSTVTSTLPHAADLYSFLLPREQASASILTRVHAETWTTADITITTAEGDTVVLSAGAVLQTAYASYDARGRLAGQGFDVHAEAAQLVASQDTAITVAGDLSDAELTDVHHLLAKLGTMAVDFLAGDLDDAVPHALGLGELDTLANFDASFEYVRHVRVEQHCTAQGNLRHTPASTEQPVASARIRPKSIERLLDSMIQVIEASQVNVETLAEALTPFTDRLMHTLTKAYGADAPKTQLAGQVLTKFADYLSAVLASET